jgi:hypothetical protein
MTNIARTRPLPKLFVIALTLAGLGPREAQAIPCSSSVLRGCWSDHSGPNFGQVAVGAIGGESLVCAVRVNSVGDGTNPDKWGGGIVCHKPAASGNQIAPVYYYGERSDDAFDEVTYRMESIAVTTWASSVDRSQHFTVNMLRSDSRLYRSSFGLPLPSSPMDLPDVKGLTPKIVATGETIQLRSIAVGSAGTLIGITRDNRVVTPVTGGWAITSTDLGATVFAANDLYLLGDAGTAKTLVTDAWAADVPSTTTLNLANTDENLAFYSFGRTSPVTRSAKDMWLVTTSDTMSTRFMRSQRTLVAGWPFFLSWSAVDLGATHATSRPLPWSVVDGSTFRGIRGELFAIGAGYHLLQYTP